MIQSFHQSTSLVSVKLDASNFFLWCSQIFLLVQSLKVCHHIIKVEPLCEILKDEKEIVVINPNHSIWINYDGLLTTWFLNVMFNKILSLNVGIDNAFQL